jgi:cytochrome P450
LWVPTARNRGYNKQRNMVNCSIQQQIANRKGTGEQHPDLLDAFRLATDKTTGRGMTTEELREELLGVYAAAHGPVAIALTYALFLLATHPAVAEKLHQELAEVLNGEEMDMEKLGSLNYTRQVVQEALRLYPPVWISGKRALKTDFLQGYEIKKNDNIIFSPMLVHRQPEFWPAPEQFIPERFDGTEKIHPFAYIPFGGGAKACIGSHLALMILQLAVAKICRKYTLSTTVKGVAINPFTTLKPLTAIMVTATEKPEVKVMQVNRSY